MNLLLKCVSFQLIRLAFDSNNVEKLQHPQTVFAIFSAFSANCRASINSLILPFSTSVQIINRESNPVICYPALREIISPDFCTPVTRAHQTFTMSGNFLFLFSYLFFI